MIEENWDMNLEPIEEKELTKKELELAKKYTELEMEIEETIALIKMHEEN